jgi:outer membrane lipoprotein-sorting protein
MKKVTLVISIFVGLFLGIFGLISGITNNFLHPQPVVAASPLDTALTSMLTSHTRWQTVQGAAEFVWYGEDGSTQTYINKFALSQPYNVYVDVVDQTGMGVDGAWISDGQNIFDINKQNNTYTKSAFRAAYKDTSSVPLQMSAIKPNTVTLYPLSTIINAPIREYIFPSWFPQGRDSDTYTLEKEDVFLGRSVWVVNLQTIYKDDTTVWVDQTTGIILRANQLMNGKKFLDMTFTVFDVNAKIDPAIFQVPANYSQVSQ